MAIQGQDVDFGRGESLTVPHTPTAADVKAGQVLVVGSLPLVAVTDIAQNTLGNVYNGGGTCTLRGVSNGTISAGGAKVAWDDTAKKFAASGGGSMIGWTLPDQGGTSDGDEIEIIYDPDGSTVT